MSEEELKEAIDRSIELMMAVELVFLAKPEEMGKYKLALLALGDHICTALGYDGYEPFLKEANITRDGDTSILWDDKKCKKKN